MITLWTFLKVLNKFKNNYSDFPPSSKIDTIILSSNKIKSIDNINNSLSLTVLDIKNNKLCGLPESIA